MANKALVYAIYPNEKQNIQCQKTFGCCRFVYNHMLSLQQDRYKNGEKHLNKKNANNYCNQQFKEDYPFLKEVDKFALTNAIYHLENGKLGVVKAKIHRKPEVGWKIKSATVTQDRDDSYQVSVLFAFEKTIPNAAATETTTIGLDYKSDGLYVSSNGETCGMPHYFRQSAGKLAKAQRKMKHKTVGSNNYKKQQKKVAKIHGHIANQRKDFLQKKSTEIANQYAFVCVEDLNMRSMANKGFGNGKATLDNGYGMFLNMLDYKLKDRGGQLVKVDRFFPSSQLCNCCGYKNPLVKDLSVRHWDCPNCGTTNIDRDINAARNIKKEGLRLLTA